MKTTPKSILSIWGDSLKSYPQAFIKVLPFTVLIALIGLVPRFIIDGMSLEGSKISLINFSGHLLVVLCYVWIGAVIILQINAILKKEPIQYKKFFITAAQKYFPLLGVLILTVLMVFGSLFLLVIPAIFVAISLYFVRCLIILDNDSIVHSISNSFKLVWGNWWRTFIIIYAPILVFSIPFVIFKLYGAMLSTSHYIILYYYLALPFVTIFITPLFILILLKQFYDLKLRKKLPQEKVRFFAIFGHWSWRAALLLGAVIFAYFSMLGSMKDLMPYIQVYSHIVAKSFVFLLYIGIVFAVFWPIKTALELVKTKSLRIPAVKSVVFFRSLIAIQLIVAGLLLFSFIFLRSSWPHAATVYSTWHTTYFDQQAGFMRHLLSAFSQAFGAVNMLSLAGIFLFNSKARYFYVISLAGWLLTAFAQVPYINSGFEMVLGHIDYLIMGALITLMFATPLKKYFK